MEGFTTETSWNDTFSPTGGTKEMRPFHHFITVYVVIVVVFGSVGNSLTAYTILSTRSLRTTANLLVASLAMADILTTLTSIPVLFSRLRFGEFYVEHPGVPCQASYYIIVMFCLVSVNHLQVIAANRYFIITRPRHVYNKYWGKLGTGVIIAIVWAYSLTLTFLPFVGFGKIEYIPELGGCGINESETLSWWYKTVLLLAVVQSCGIVTPVFFALTFKKIRATQRRVLARSITAALPAATAAGGGGKPKGFSRHELAVTRMTVSAFLCFVCSWSPYLILHVATIGKTKPGDIATFFLIFAFSSSVYNPAIYAGMNKNFRAAFCLTRHVRRSESSGNTDSAATNSARS